MFRCVATLLVAVSLAQAAQAQIACESLKGLQFPDVKITDAKAEASPASLSPPGAKQIPVCTVTGVIGREIGFVVTMPDAWNGKFVQGGTGGSAGRIDNQAGRVYGALQLGYATATTDTGHITAPGNAWGWALDDSFLRAERLVNFYHLAVHRLATVSKAVTTARYGRMPDRSYFAGCSNGGRQGLMEALRYPDDFDGVVAGAPVVSARALAMPTIDLSRRLFPDPRNSKTYVIDRADRLALGAAVMTACDGADGLKDGVVSAPETCRFDPAVVACKRGKTDGCLSPEALAAVKAWYKGPSANGVKLGPPHFPGHEEEDSGWGAFVTGDLVPAGAGEPGRGARSMGTDIIGTLVHGNAAWDYTKPSLDQISTSLSALAAFDADSPDLSVFRKKGGKILIWHGLADPTISPVASTQHVDAIEANDASARNDVRLFLMPGVLHCGGGPGPQQVDWLTALDKWVSAGKAPDEIGVSFDGGGSTRKLCAYPKRQVFKGQGDGRNSDQFECR